jgi:hypothetical protein
MPFSYRIVVGVTALIERLCFPVSPFVYIFLRFAFLTTRAYCITGLWAAQLAQK